MHTRLFWVESDLASRLDEMSEEYSRGWKMRAANTAIEMFLREEEIESGWGSRPHPRRVSNHLDPLKKTFHVLGRPGHFAYDACDHSKRERKRGRKNRQVCSL